ncbi:DOMON-like domain-containing protein [Streptomyces antimycoticus]|uniref:DOMON-like domain-containing protein n=1 Tax=Streptomyces antimycoticus TaxID=68175 RepID=UPI00343CA9D6
MRALDAHLQEPTPGTYVLRYVLDADLSRLRIPGTRPSHHVDGLWKHTCFEMFVRKATDAPAYYELNASPSTEWAIYTFDGYHQNMAPVSSERPPRIRVTHEPNRLEIEIRADLRGLPHAAEIALAAVIEDDNGTLSYWALKHAASKPDFHHPDSFVLKP